MSYKEVHFNVHTKSVSTYCIIAVLAKILTYLLNVKRIKTNLKEVVMN